MIRDMEEQGLVEQSTSPWATPVVLAKKKDGSPRLCIDYRRLNDITESDAYPMPDINTLLRQMLGAKVYSVLDLKSDRIERMQVTTKVDSLTPNECLSYIETVKHSEITEVFSQCRNIKLPTDVIEIAELNFGFLFSLELPNKLTKEEFTQKFIEEKIQLFSVHKSLYLYYFLSKD
ncbi:hypothetical protein QTP88_023796 [Uroleucon formosanum]